ncbi:ATP synthase d subunit [Polyrhizophydium stewartii]|uniref:ATP synthase subunit d, mitochondrial n=1 Tax=Polyrhizophydium stewartii TaxID=2732419 RepID=A0ABR4MXL6_9FUNG|nr:ATP synthase d subunit [Polyrhizophydium stewartii]
MSAKAAAATAARIDWTALSAKLKPDTVAAVNAFRRRHADAAKAVRELKDHQVSIDIERYRAVLKNQKVVEEAERALKSFRPATVDLTDQLRVIETHEAKAVAAAQATVSKISTELVELQDMIKNIDTARPLEQLTVDDVAKAYPQLDATVEKMVKRGQWRIPGYYEKFGEFVVGF